MYTIFLLFIFCYLGRNEKYHKRPNPRRIRDRLRQNFLRTVREDLQEVDFRIKEIDEWAF